MRMKTIEELLDIDRKPLSNLTKKEVDIILENKQKINLDRYKYKV